MNSDWLIRLTAVTQHPMHQYICIAEEEHREHQLSLGSGDEEWQVRAWLQTDLEDTASGQG